jgi:hypothetical protein
MHLKGMKILNFELLLFFEMFLWFIKKCFDNAFVNLKKTNNCFALDNPMLSNLWELAFWEPAFLNKLECWYLAPFPKVKKWSFKENWAGASTPL